MPDAPWTMRVAVAPVSAAKVDFPANAAKVRRLGLTVCDPPRRFGARSLAGVTMVGHKQLLKAGLVQSSIKPDGTTLLDRGV
jgi:hypothetical protein